MDNKRQVLIVTNAITSEEIHEIKQAFDGQYAKNMNIKLNLVHIIPRLPTCYFNIPAMGILMEKYYLEARELLNHVGKHLNISTKDQWLISGKARSEVIRLANKLGSSFILAGAEQIKELQHSLFFKNIQQHDNIRNINQLKQL
jgi:hypothetical protein